MTVRELLSRTSSAELSEWAAYERITGPLGAERSDLQAGIIAATIANVMGGKGKPAVPSDFIPVWDRRPLGAEELLNKVRQANAAFGGTERKA